MKKNTSNKNEINKKAKFRKQNRKLFGTFVLIFSFILLINATLSWSSFAEWVKNHMQSKPEEIAVKVVEVFDPTKPLIYGQEMKKEVKVKNTSTQQAIIRVQLNESYLPFVIDIENGANKEGKSRGNGSLKKVLKQAGDEELNNQLPKGWQAGKLYDSEDKVQEDGPDKGKNLYYVATDPIHKNVPYVFADTTGSRPKELKNFDLIFHNSVKKISASVSYETAWFYEDGFFYYSNVLEPGETTKIELLKEVKVVNNNLPNEFKYSFYNIDIDAYGITPSKAGLREWTNSVPLLTMYKLDSRFRVE